MSKIFVLRDAEIARRMVNYVKAIAGPAAAAGRPLMVTIDEYSAKRSSQANARYWALLEDISEQAVIEGKRFSREAWHTYFREKYAPKEDGPAGLVAMSTSQMNKETFANYMQRVEVAAVQTLGVELLEV
jgi:hypothetical protein